MGREYNPRRAKIVCTLGPATASEKMVDRLVRAGMDVARLNFSHGTHEEHQRMFAAVRAASGKHQKPIAILADLQGPKIRTGRLEGGKPVKLKAGQRFVISTKQKKGDSTGVSTSYRGLPRELSKGDRVLLADGLIELRVLSTTSTEVRTEVVNGGELGELKGINLPGVRLRTPAVTAKDRRDLAFALEQGADYIAVSFVQRPEDLELARRLVRRAGSDTPLVAKLEKPEAIENLDAILAVTDGVMVARGDLGVEMPPEEVPVVQKRIIGRARDLHLPVITATQMLESMTVNPRPTRAEASDVANAIFDGTDAVMLSAETATGRYPVETVQMMDRIIRHAETAGAITARPVHAGEMGVGEAISEAVCHAAEELRMKVIAVFTQSGWTARLVSKYRPRPPIIVFSPLQPTRRRASLLWGVVPRRIEPVKDVDGLARAAEQRLLEEKLVRKGDVVGIVAGTPLGIRGTTNLLKLHTIGK